jgi:pimeloyl-ACP methyl ester carboxylesterase
MQVKFSALFSEFRAGFEFLEAIGSLPADDLPHGDGKPVMLVPGLWGGDESLFILRRNLAHLGYDARTWRLGRNNRCGESTVEHLLGKIGAFAGRSDRPVALIGHSRGGFIAREAARRVPNLVDRVITLGTPIGGQSVTEASFMVQALMAVSRRLFAERPGCMTEKCGCTYVQHFSTSLPPGVATYSLWSKDDGVVIPEQCVVPGENCVEVKGTHVGMVASRDTFAVIAKLLQEPIAAATP